MFLILAPEPEPPNPVPVALARYCAREDLLDDPLGNPACAVGTFARTAYVVEILLMALITSQLQGGHAFRGPRDTKITYDTPKGI